MTEYLQPDELDRVRDAAVAAFADPQWRPVLFQGVLREWVATLPVLAIPAAQIMSDLAAMNRVERLVDGRVPLEIWLHNAARTTAEAGPREVFEQARDQVARAAAGEPDLGSAGAVDEVQEEIIFRDDTVHIGYLAEGAAAGRAVARILVSPYQNGAPVTNPAGLPEPHAGTGWLLTPTLLVTNHHVINARTAIRGPALQAGEADLALQASHAVVRFDYDAEQQAGVEVTGAELVAWSAELDYAVLRLAADPGREPLPVHAEPLDATLADNVAVNVIQHPDGKAKRVGLRNNIVHDTSEQDVRYFTDTQRGSSGSPVLTDAWAVCALHRGARRVDVKFQGKQSAYVNVGTQIAAVLADLKARYPAVHDEVGAAG
jgi:endonuclease G, mitochondrial